MDNRLKELEKKIGYTFQDPELLKTALMHSSYTNEQHIPKHRCNERLEFLGDAVLELVSSEFLFRRSPKMPEGKLTKLRASMVCEPSLAMCARDIGLGSYLYLGKGEESTGGRHRDSVTSDALEALIGAVYLDGGFTNAKEFIHQFVLTDLENKQLFYDSKTILQEIVQADEKAGFPTDLREKKGRITTSLSVWKSESVILSMVPERDIRKRRQSSRRPIRQFCGCAGRDKGVICI